MQTIQHLNLPRTVIFGDGWMGRGMWLRDGRFGLQEWHTGGVGVAALDLGRLLLGCHWSAENVVTETIVPSKERIHAVLDGYGRCRTLLAEERAALLHAIRFSTGYGGAEHISHVYRTGWTPKLEKKIARRRQWFEASGEIARIAEAYLA